jgi:hypothetical protein
VHEAAQLIEAKAADVRLALVGPEDQGPELLAATEARA